MNTQHTELLLEYLIDKNQWHILKLVYEDVESMRFSSKVLNILTRNLEHVFI